MAATALSHVQTQKPLRYEGPIPVREQVAILKWHFPKIDDSHVDGLIERYSTDLPSEDGPYRGVARRELASPKGSEGWFAVLKWQSLGIRDYDVAVTALVHAAGLEPKASCFRIARRSDTADRLAGLGKEQAGDIMIFPAQLGSRFRGMGLEPDEARLRFGPDEFGLDAFAVGCMLLTHPSRLLDRRATDIALLGNDLYDTRSRGPAGTPMRCGGCLRYVVTFDETDAYRHLHVADNARVESGEISLCETHADCATAFVPRVA